MLGLVETEAAKLKFQVLRVHASPTLRREHSSEPESVIVNVIECARGLRHDHDLGSANGMHELLSFLFRLNSRTQAYTSTLPLLVLCDDIEPLISVMNAVLHLTSTEDEYNSHRVEDEHLLANALLLTSLLSAISDAAFSPVSQPRVVVLACCFLSAKTAFPSGLSFEKVIMIPRPSIFDRELLFHRGLSESVLEEIDDHTYRTENKLSQEVKLDICKIWAFHLARLSRGYRPGDISKVLERVRTMAGCNGDVGALITWNIMLKAISLVRPLQIEKLKEIARPVDSEALRLSWNDFVGQKDVKRKLRLILRQMETCSIDSRRDQLMNVVGSLNSGIIIYGPSGSGKSYLAKIIACECKANYVHVRCTELLSKYFGETEANIRTVFHNAVAPCIIFFDEFDVFAHRRCRNIFSYCKFSHTQLRSSEDDSNGLHARVLSTFLNELDGAVMRTSDGEGGILVIVACESLDALDPALVRPGRLSFHIELDLPSEDDIIAMLTYKLQGVPIREDSCLDVIGETLFKFRASYADVDFVCREAILFALRDVVNQLSQGIPVECNSYEKLSHHHLLAAVRKRYGA